LEYCKPIMKRWKQYQIVEKIRENGFRKINRSNFIVLVGKKDNPGILGKIVDGSISDKEKWLNALEDANNNSTSQTLYNHFPYILSVLQTIYTDLDIKEEDKPFIYDSIKKEWLYGIKKNIEESEEFIIERNFLGLYYYYTHSPENKDMILKQPLLIRKNSIDSSIEVFLGNKNSNFRYKGVALKIASDFILLSLIDFHRSISEVVTISLSLPNVSRPKFLRGTYSKKGIYNEPLCGRAVTIFYKPKITIEEFNKIQFEPFNDSFNPNMSENDFFVLQYLKDEIQSNLYFHPNVNPLSPIGKELYLEKSWLMDKFKEFEGFFPLEYSFYSPLSNNSGDWSYNELEKDFPSDVRGKWIGYIEIGDMFNKVIIFICYFEQVGSRVIMKYEQFSNFSETIIGTGTGYISDNMLSISFCKKESSHFDKAEVGFLFLRKFDNSLVGEFKQFEASAKDSQVDSPLVEQGKIEFLRTPYLAYGEGFEFEGEISFEEEEEHPSYSPYYFDFDTAYDRHAFYIETIEKERKEASKRNKRDSFWEEE